jgi:hypothetical protein
LIDVENTITQAIRIIQEEVVKQGNDYDRIEPLINRGLARSGKTTFLELTFDKLKNDPSGEYAPIIISFNGSFKRRKNETCKQALLRLIATQLINLPQGQDPTNIVCDEQYLDNYLDTVGNSGKKKIVLLIDELNRLSAPLDEDTSIFLKEKFLDKPNRYLVFTTHVQLILGNNRSYKTVPQPKCREFNEFQVIPECDSLTPVEICLYSRIPALIYSVKTGKFNPSKYFNDQNIVIPKDSRDFVLMNFIKELLNGKTHNNMHLFDALAQFTSENKLRWPLCFIVCILKKLVSDNIKDELNELYNKLLTYSKETQTGLDWEAIVKFAIVFRMLDASLNGSNGALGLIPDKSYPDMIMKSLPAVIITVEQAIDYIEKVALNYKGPLVIIATPIFSKFPLFDGFIYKRDKEGNSEIVGYQCKLGRASPEEPAPKGISRGYLIRGKEPEQTNKVKKGWEYLEKAEIIKLLGYSLEDLYPNEWPEIPSSNNNL